MRRLGVGAAGAIRSSYLSCAAALPLGFQHEGIPGPSHAWSTSYGARSCQTRSFTATPHLRKAASGTSSRSAAGADPKQSEGKGEGSRPTRGKRSHQSADSGVTTTTTTTGACGNGGAEQPDVQQVTHLSPEAAAAVSLARSQLKKRSTSRASGARHSKKTAATAAPAVVTSAPSSTGNGTPRKPRRASNKAAATGGGSAGGSKRGRGSGFRGGESEKAPRTVVAPTADDPHPSTQAQMPGGVPSHLEDTPAVTGGDALVPWNALCKFDTETAASPLYYTETCHHKRKTPPTEAELIAERASITKLFIISESIACLFTAVNNGEMSVNEYLNEVDRAIPSSSSCRTSLPEEAQEVYDGDAVEDDLYFNQQAENILSFDQLCQRVMLDSCADHAIRIHVRDLEQLVPPAHLLADPKPVPAAVPPPVPSRSRRQSSRRRDKQRLTSASTQTPTSTALAPPPVPAEPPLTPAEAALRTLERIKALNRWKANAAERAKTSQARHAHPDDCHSITRVRLHEPFAADYTVVQGSGGPKSVDDILDAMRRKLTGGSHGGARPHRRRTSLFDDAGEDDANPPAFSRDAGGDESLDLELLNAMGAYSMLAGLASGSEALPHDFQQRIANALARQQEAEKKPADPLALVADTPFEVKPLLTVHAQCLPRRCRQLTARYDEALFIAQAGLPNDVALGTSNSEGEEQPQPMTRRRRLTDEEMYQVIKAHGVPPMPRYKTRMTVIVEHNDLDPGDLLSLAEITSTRQHGSSASGRCSSQAQPPSAGDEGQPRQRCPRGYILVVDAGEV